VQKGLKIMAEAPAGAGPDQLSRLAGVLRGVWTGPGASAPAERRK
jgi:hypothetical protein